MKATEDATAGRISSYGDGLRCRCGMNGLRQRCYRSLKGRGFAPVQEREWDRPYKFRKNEKDAK